MYVEENKNRSFIILLNVLSKYSKHISKHKHEI